MVERDSSDLRQRDRFRAAGRTLWNELYTGAGAPTVAFFLIKDMPELNGGESPLWLKIVAPIAAAGIVVYDAAQAYRTGEPRDRLP